MLRPRFPLAVRAALSLSGLMLVTAAGWATTRATIDDGLIAFSADRQEAAVAQSAVTVVRHVRGHPILRFLMPAVRVIDVRRAPGNCIEYPATADIPNLDYEASVRIYTLFAIPINTHRATCGGWAA